MFRTGRPEQRLLFVAVTAPLVLVAALLAGSAFVGLVPVLPSGGLDRLAVAALMLGLFTAFVTVAGAIGVLLVRGAGRAGDVDWAVNQVGLADSDIATATSVIFSIYVVGVAVQQFTAVLPEVTVAPRSLLAVLVWPFAPFVPFSQLVFPLGGPSIVTVTLAAGLLAMTGVWQILLGVLVARASALIGPRLTPAVGSERK